MVTDRQRRSQDLSRQNWTMKIQRLALARTSGEKLAAEFDLLRLAAERQTPGERDQIFDEIAETIRRRRVTLGDFTSSTSHRTSRRPSRNGAPQGAHARVNDSVTTATGSEQ